MRKKSNKIYNHISMRHTDETIEKFGDERKTQIVSKFYSPLVTIMGLDYNSITKSTAARILSHETPELH